MKKHRVVKLLSGKWALQFAYNDNKVKKWAFCCRNGIFRTGIRYFKSEEAALRLLLHYEYQDTVDRVIRQIGEE